MYAMTIPPGMVGVPEACVVLGISRQRCYQLIRMGVLPSEKFGKRVYIPQEAIDTRVAAQRRQRSNQCITTEEVAAFFGVDSRTVRDWHLRGLLRASKINNRLCFSPSTILAFDPPTYSGVGRLPGKKPTRTLRGRYYPSRKEQENGASQRDGAGTPHEGP